MIERLAQDLRTAFPEMKGFSPRNLKYMRVFAEAWSDGEFVQQAAAQLPWGHNLVLLDKLNTPEKRHWYSAKAIEHNWSQNILVVDALDEQAQSFYEQFAFSLLNPGAKPAGSSTRPRRVYEYDVLAVK